MLEVDRMERGAPLAPGPYNPDALASRAIGELSSISPAFARAWLSYTKDLESLTHAPRRPSCAAMPPRSATTDDLASLPCLLPLRAKAKGVGCQACAWHRSPSR